MAPDSVTEVFNKGHNEARALYEEGKLDEAAEKADQLLDDEGISRYRRIKCYMLIAACLDDWMDADILRAKSELLWQLERQKVTERGMHDT
ncbi:hypothetical protein Q7P35_002738 [Cladosporium inversicolor]